MALTYKEYDLNGSSIEKISADLQAYLKNPNLERRNIQRLRLTVEGLLLNIMEGCGKGIRISVGVGRHFGRHLLRIRCKSAPFDHRTNVWKYARYQSQQASIPLPYIPPAVPLFDQTALAFPVAFRLPVCYTERDEKGRTSVSLGEMKRPNLHLEEYSNEPKNHAFRCRSYRQRTIGSFAE